MLTSNIDLRNIFTAWQARQLFTQSVLEWRLLHQ